MCRSGYPDVERPRTVALEDRRGRRTEGNGWSSVRSAVVERERTRHAPCNVVVRRYGRASRRRRSFVRTADVVTCRRGNSPIFRTIGCRRSSRRTITHVDDVTYETTVFRRRPREPRRCSPVSEPACRRFRGDPATCRNITVLLGGRRLSSNTPTDIPNSITRTDKTHNNPREHASRSETPGLLGFFPLNPITSSKY